MSFNCTNMIVLSFMISTSFASFEIWKWYSPAVSAHHLPVLRSGNGTVLLCTNSLTSMPCKDSAQIPHVPLILIR